MKQNKKKFLLLAGPLLLVLFIDGMGLGLVFPILNGLIFDQQSHFLAAASYTPTMHNVIYGVIISIFMLCWFFGAAVLGDLSDHIGRKKSLIICLVGAFLSYLVSALSVSLQSLSLLIIGRIIAGFTSGSQPIAQAAIIDLSEPQHKARNIGYILLAVSFGFIAGPLLGGVLSDHAFVAWFNYATPFYFAAIISFLNVILLCVMFKETFVSKSTTFAVNLYAAIPIFISAFQHKKVRGLSIIFFIFIFGWSSFYSFIPIYLFKTFQFTPTKVSLFMCVMGVGFAIGNGYLVNFLAKLFSLAAIFIINTLITAILAFLMVMMSKQLFCWLSLAPLACAASVAYAAVLTIFSNQVDEKSQGWVMGITGSIMALVFAINGVIVGTLVTFNAGIPLYIAALCLFITALSTRLFYRPTS